MESFIRIFVCVDLQMCFSCVLLCQLMISLNLFCTLMERGVVLGGLDEILSGEELGDLR